MAASFSLKALAAGLLAAFVGFASSFAIVVQGLTGVGASPGEAASGLMALSISMGLCAVYLSLKTGMPISVAWSTPGAAFLATVGPLEGGFSAAVGAFVVTAVLIILAGFWRPLGRAISRIPTPIASAMLAGVVLPLCLAPFEAIAKFPTIGLLVVLAFVIVARINRLLAVPAAIAVATVAIAFEADGAALAGMSLWSDPVWLTPTFSLQALIGIAIPLFIITMASQNITGIAVLNSFGYRPDAGSMFRWTGAFSLASAPFGGHAVNLAAITAAICADENAHPDAKRRYWSAVVAGVAYVVLGLAAGAAVAFMGVAPPLLIAAVAGLALLGALGGALVSALSQEASREAALITFLVTASGISFYGIGGAFWGLLAGGAIYLWDNRKALAQ